MESVEPGDQPASIVLRGLLVDGLGEGRRFTGLEWVRRRFRDLLAIDPYPGTVNVRLASEEQRAALARLRASRGIPLPPEHGFCAATCYPATITGPAGCPHIPAAIVVPEVPGYPSDQVELVAALHVRDALGVCPGDQLTIRVAL